MHMIRIATVAVVGLTVSASLLFAVEPSPNGSRTLRLDGGPFLFVDDSGIATSSGVSRTVHTAKTLAKPVIESDDLRPHSSVGNALCGVPGSPRSRSVTLHGTSTKGVPYRM